MQPFLPLPKEFLELCEFARIYELFLEWETRSTSAPILHFFARKKPFPFGKSNTSSFEQFLFLAFIKSSELFCNWCTYEPYCIKLDLHRNLRSRASTLDKRDKNSMNILFKKWCNRIFVEHKMRWLWEFLSVKNIVTYSIPERRKNQNDFYSQSCRTWIDAYFLLFSKNLYT